MKKKTISGRSILHVGATLALGVFFLGASASTAQAVNCTETIKAIQTEGSGKILVQFHNNTWHVVANDSHGAREDRLSLVTAAKLSGLRIYLRYSGSSCNSTDYGTVPTLIRLVD